jgi:tetratricopeptide (TPR) repeat protein
MVGKKISQYKIIEKLGEGGMGVVYKAQDTKLDRFVALKFLPPHIGQAEEEKKRFIHEAKAASALDHNNICTIYEINETEDGQMFIAMAYYEGKTLKTRIEQGPLALEKAIDIGTQVAQGLARAHEEKIVHRDIKPANIMITERDEIKVLDFGLAKLTGRTVLTKEGTTLGTVAYMSPEQAQGIDVDMRADIWAVGSVLYEMFTGQQPFKGDYEQAVIYSIMHEDPEPMTTLRTGLPMELERIVNKCLAKKPPERYQHADELIVDLRQVQKQSKSKVGAFQKDARRKRRGRASQTFLLPGLLLIAAMIAVGYFAFIREPESTERVPIAVVDFVNETDEKELNGLSGMLITALEQSRRLSVLTRSRMLDILKQMDKEDVDRIDEALGREICQKAKVSAMAIAAIRKFGEVYSIDLKVLDPQDNEYLFTAKVDGKGQESIPSLIDQLSEQTRKGFKEHVAEISVARRSIAKTTTTSLEAYHYYFLGKQFGHKLQFDQAEEEQKKAIALDSTFALAYYEIASARYWNLRKPAKKWIQKAMNYIHKVPEKEQYLIRALQASIDEKPVQALGLYQELIKSYPDEKEALYQIGDLTSHTGDYQTAEKYLARVLELDPASERAWGHIIPAYAFMENCDKALEFAKQYAATNPSESAYEVLAETYNVKADYEGAFQTHRRALVLFPKSVEPIIGTGITYIFKDEYEKAETEFMKLLSTSRPLKQQREGYRNLLRVYAYMGKFSEVARMFDRVIEINQGLGDKQDLARSYADQAFWLVAGRNEEKQARIALAKGLELVDSANIFFYWSLFHSYLKLAEYQKASEIAQNSMALWFTRLDNIIEGYRHRSQGQYEDAIKAFQGGRSMDRILVDYDLALCYVEARQNKRAVEAIEKMQQPIFVFQDLNFFWHRAVVYPRSSYLLGQIYENMGNLKLAIENYEKFLDLWKNADEDLPDLMEAKSRLVKLKGISNK